MTWSMTLSTVTSSCLTPLLRPRASTDGALLNTAYIANWGKRSCPSLARSLPEATQSQCAGCWPNSAWDQRWRTWGGDLEVQEVPDRSGYRLPGSCHTGEAAACPGGSVGLQVWCHLSLAPWPWATDCLGALAEVLPSPRGVGRLGESALGTIRAVLEGNTQ